MKLVGNNFIQHRFGVASQHLYDENMQMFGVDKIEHVSTILHVFVLYRTFPSRLELIGSDRTNFKIIFGKIINRNFQPNKYFVWTTVFYTILAGSFEVVMIPKSGKSPHIYTVQGTSKEKKSTSLYRIISFNFRSNSLRLIKFTE